MTVARLALPMKQRSRVVILIPGIFDYGKSMHRMADALIAQGFDAHYIRLRPNTGWHGMEALAVQLRDLIESVAQAEQTCSLVGFSMGGIVARYYLQRMGGVARVHKFISLSSPHFGSFWANFLPYKGGSQLRVGSEFLTELNRETELLESTAPVSIWTPYDFTILPQTSSRLPLGAGYEVPVPLHRWVPLNAEVIDLVTAELEGALEQGSLSGTGGGSRQG